MRKVMWTIIVILIALTMFAIGLNENQGTLIPSYFKAMANPDWLLWIKLGIGA